MKCNFCHKKLQKVKQWQIFWLSIQIQEQLDFMKISQMRLLKSASSKPPSKNKSGNYSLMARQEKVPYEIL